LSFRMASDLEAPPLLTERYFLVSIATRQRRLIVVLVQRLPRCPCFATGLMREERLSS
jgi:hypothetical protein